MLFLNDNKLKFINPMLLSSATVLESIDLTSKDCIDLSFSTPQFTLEEIQTKIMDKCVGPVELRCNHKIKDEQIDEKQCEAKDLFVTYRATTLIFLNDLNAGAIEVLSIIDQKTLFVPFKLAERLPKLVRLVIERSQLNILNKNDFKGMTSLKETKIELNDISGIEEGVFDEVPQLEHLSLASNNIKSLPPKAFAMLTKLKTLTLSNNRLLKFTASLLPRQNVIEEFQLQDNKLELIESKAFRLLRNAELIDLSNNTCVDMKYQKSETKQDSTLKDLVGHVELECFDSEEYL